MSTVRALQISFAGYACGGRHSREFSFTFAERQAFPHREAAEPPLNL